MSGNDSAGKYRRLRFDAPNLEEALLLADDLLSQSELESSVEKSSSKVRISEALFRASKSRNWTDYTRVRDAFYCEYFLTWIDTQHLHYWDELRLEHVQEYQKYLEQKEYAPDTIRLYLLPVRRTSSWMAANWPHDYVDICRLFRLSKKHSGLNLYSEEDGNPYLPIVRLMDFLDWLSRNPNLSQLAAGVALQGLAGMQLQEVHRLKWDQVDLVMGTVVIEERVKNPYRVRKIPVANVVQYLLGQCARELSNSNFVISNFTHFNQYSKAIKRNMLKWDAESRICSKDLRNTIQTDAIENGWYGYYVQRYVGHSPKSIGERHYCGDQGKRLLPLFRDKVVSHIEAKISEWECPEDSILTPYFRVIQGGKQQKCMKIARLENRAELHGGGQPVSQVK